MTALTGSIVASVSLAGSLGNFTSYLDTVAAIETSNLIAYWPLRELTGTDADNYEVTASRDGTYTNVTLANTTGPMSGDAPKFDGSTSYVDIYSSSLNTACGRLDPAAAFLLAEFNKGLKPRYSR